MSNTTLEVKKANVLKAFANTDENGKKILSDLFGSDVLLGNIMDRVKTFDDALAICPASDNQKILLDYNGIDKDMLAAQAFLKLSIIRKALNEGWEPNWDNSSEYKYYPWFTNKSGLGLSYGGYGHSNTVTGVGSRLVFKTSALAIYAGKQFETIYRDFFNL